jgi:predicted DNA-binding transcriptional regulator YafY
MAEKKTIAFAVLQVLQKYTDSEHILTRDELFNHLKVGYDIQMDRRTLYTCVDMLQGFGYQISDYRMNGKGYQLVDREFEESEAELLCNAVHASNFIPRRHSDELIRKILSTQSEYVTQDYRHTVYMENLRKKENPEFFQNLQKLMEAIRCRQKVQFKYMHYDLNKHMVPRRKEPYIVSPYYMVYYNGKAYLICRSEHHEDTFSHYRVDRIQKVKILEEQAPKLKKKEDPYRYAANKLYMYGGEEVSVKLVCDNRVLDDLIDLYGKSIPISAADETHFKTTIRSTAQGAVILAQQYLGSMEVIEPAEVRDAVLEQLKQGIEKYSK